MKLLYMYTRVEQLQKYNVHNKIEVSHCPREKLQINNKQKSRINPVVLTGLEPEKQDKLMLNGLYLQIGI